MVTLPFSLLPYNNQIYQEHIAVTLSNPFQVQFLLNLFNFHYECLQIGI